MWLRIFAFSLLVLAGCANTHNAKWHTYDAGPFTFTLPAGLTKTSAVGIDSYVSEFNGQNMTITFDYGMYSNDFQDWPASTEFERVTIDGRMAKIGKNRGSFHQRFPFITQVYFKSTSVSREGNSLAMFADCKTLEDCALAKRVFYSIKFKQ